MRLPDLHLAWEGITHPRWLLGTALRTLLRRGMPHFENSGVGRGAPIVSANVMRDFGARDHYTGVMKGVMLSICPDATLVDISHEVPAHDVAFAARELAATYKYFPPGTIFLVVIDPGVGTGRRGLAAEAGEWRFVAPDNGVLTAVFQETPPKRVVELTERRYARPTVSRTFEGRDRFAPAAAFIAKGIQLPAFGRAVSDFHLLPLPQPCSSWPISHRTRPAATRVRRSWSSTARRTHIGRRF